MHCHNVVKRETHMLRGGGTLRAARHLHAMQSFYRPFFKDRKDTGEDSKSSGWPTRSALEASIRATHKQQQACPRFHWRAPQPSAGGEQRNDMMAPLSTGCCECKLTRSDSTTAQYSLHDCTKTNAAEPHTPSFRHLTQGSRGDYSRPDQPLAEAV